jgi:hypothetical protein
VTHKAIKRFQMDGIIKDDKDIPRLREQYIKLMIDDMRGRGYVQHLDVAPAFSVSYNSEKSNYSFLLTIHGVYYGPNRAKELYGITNSREISFK